MSDIAMWKVPTGIAANSTVSLFTRIEHYTFDQSHELNDGTKVLPHAGTAISVINAYDEFGPDIPVAVSSGSYVLASNQ